MDQDTLLQIVGQLYIASYMKDQQIIQHNNQLNQLRSDLEANRKIIQAIRTEYPEIAQMLDKGIKNKNDTE